MEGDDQRAAPRGPARSGTGRGIGELRKRHLFERPGEKYYAVHRGRGSRAEVTTAVADIESHARSPGGTRTEGVMGPPARQIMHSDAEYIGDADSRAVAATKMRSLNVGSLPICGADNHFHGAITDRDTPS